MLGTLPSSSRTRCFTSSTACLLTRRSCWLLMSFRRATGGTTRCNCVHLAASQKALPGLDRPSVDCIGPDLSRPDRCRTIFLTCPSCWDLCRSQSHIIFGPSAIQVAVTYAVSAHRGVVQVPRSMHVSVLTKCWQSTSAGLQGVADADSQYGAHHEDCSLRARVLPCL